MDLRTFERPIWLDPRIEVRPSRIQGRGLFVREDVAKGERLITWGSRLLTLEEIAADRYIRGSAVQISSEYYLGSRLGDESSPAIFLNHSCDPNIKMNQGAIFMACRDIAKDEEILADYGTLTRNPQWRLEIDCCCGAPNCRKIIVAVTGDP